MHTYTAEDFDIEMDELDSDAASSSRAAMATDTVKRRRRTTKKEQAILEALFEESRTPSTEARQRVCTQIDMSMRKLQVWLQNRRQKEKKDAGKWKPSPSSSSVTTPNPNATTLSGGSGQEGGPSPHQSQSQGAYAQPVAMPSSPAVSSFSSPVVMRAHTGGAAHGHGYGHGHGHGHDRTHPTASASALTLPSISIMTANCPVDGPSRAVSSPAVEQHTASETPPSPPQQEEEASSHLQVQRPVSPSTTATARLSPLLLTTSLPPPPPLHRSHSLPVPLLRDTSARPSSAPPTQTTFLPSLSLSSTWSGSSVTSTRTHAPMQTATATLPPLQHALTARHPDPNPDCSREAGIFPHTASARSIAALPAIVPALRLPSASAPGAAVGVGGLIAPLGVPLARRHSAHNLPPFNQHQRQLPVSSSASTPVPAPAPAAGRAAQLWDNLDSDPVEPEEQQTESARRRSLDVDCDHAGDGAKAASASSGMDVGARRGSIRMEDILGSARKRRGISALPFTSASACRPLGARAAQPQPQPQPQSQDGRARSILQVLPNGVASLPSSLRPPAASSTTLAPKPAALNAQPHSRVSAGRKRTYSKTLHRAASMDHLSAAAAAAAAAALSSRSCSSGHTTPAKMDKENRDPFLLAAGAGPGAYRPALSRARSYQDTTTAQRYSSSASSSGSISLRNVGPANASKKARTDSRAVATADKENAGDDDDMFNTVVYAVAAASASMEDLDDLSFASTSTSTAMTYASSSSSSSSGSDSDSDGYMIERGNGVWNGLQRAGTSVLPRYTGYKRPVAAAPVPGPRPALAGKGHSKKQSITAEMEADAAAVLAGLGGMA